MQWLVSDILINLVVPTFELTTNYCKHLLYYMKDLKLLLYCALIAMTFNLISHHGIKLSRIHTPTYWIWTGGLFVAIILSLLFIHVMRGAWIKRWMDKYPHLDLVRNATFNGTGLPFKDKALGILSTASLVLGIYLFIIFLIAHVRSHDTALLFNSYLHVYAPIIAVGTLIYLYFVFDRGRIWWLDQDLINFFIQHGMFVPPAGEHWLYKGDVVEVQKIVREEVQVVPPSVLDEQIPISALFDVLHAVSKLGPYRNADGAIRFFDVAFFKTGRQLKEVVLVNGEVITAKAFWRNLKEMGLDRWFFKTNENTMVNMMLIIYPMGRGTTRLNFHKEVESKLRMGLSQFIISTSLELSTYMKQQKKLDDFLDNIRELRHEGWDDFIPLN